MYAKSNIQNALVLSYIVLRRIIGCIGIALPFVLVFGKILLESPGILGSISGYYYSVMRDVFVGSLCTIAIFFLSYRGYEWLDDVAGDLACAFAIGIALFPMTPIVGATEQERTTGMLHLLFGACFFATLAFFALVLFRKTDQNGKLTRRKQQRNGVYLVCGSVIVVCLVLLILIQTLPNPWPWIQPFNPIFWLESFAIFAFGISWFVKGETLLKDE